jgi:hypothetical protein
MTRNRLILTTAAALSLAAGTAAADCRAELDQLTRVAKTGTMAPLEGSTGETPQVGGDDTAQADAGGGETSAEGVAKDGSMEPLGAKEDLAMSGQDAAAQQEGGATAAEQAAGAPAGSDFDAAIARAEAALDDGDEHACMAAVEDARAM